jgi:Zn-dependent metalloprotease
MPRAPRRLLAIPAVVALVLAVAACDNRSIGNEDPQPQTLIPSAEYAAAHPDTDLASRLADMQGVIDELRSSTGSGWVGRQDDVTGYLGELSGGRWAADDATDEAGTATAFLEKYAADLFGVPAEQVVVGPDAETDAGGASSLDATQQVDGVPVLDGGLTMTVGGPDEQPRLNAVRGRVFPDLDVATDPRLSPDRAEKIVRRLTRGEVSGEPRLVVLPRDSGQLAWEINVVAAGTTESGVQLSDGLYYLDAVSGKVLDVRPTSAELAAPSVFNRLLSKASPRVSRRVTEMVLASLGAPKGQPVDVTGNAPYLGRVTAKGLRTGQGVSLVDTTTPTYDPSTGKGGIYTFTADGSSSNSALPGRQYVENGTEISDPDAIGAQKVSRIVFDYYASIGRASWDGHGASILSTVNFSDGAYCNAFFSSGLQQMVYGNPCEGPNGATQLVTLDVTGHEITHGVTDSTAGLNYTGQSGALNESFSDYFGNVIGDHYYQRDSNTIGEDACTGVTGPQTLCDSNESGTLAVRYLLNHNTMDDYLNVLDPPFRWTLAVGRITDNGGVHSNSAIWNNALWSIRTQLAKIDNKPAYQSPLAHDFDLIVYYALTHQLTPNSTMVDAANAVKDTAVKAGAAATIIRVAKEIFDQNELCAGCYDPGPIPGDIVSNDPQAEVSPVVSGKKIAWLNPVGGPGTPTVTGGIAKNPLTFDLAWAGGSLVTAEVFQGSEAIVLHDSNGKATKLDDLSFSGFLAGLAGSEDGAAWWNGDSSTLSYVDANGKVTRVKINGLGGDNVTALAAGGGTVGLGTQQGRVAVWTPGTNRIDQVGTMSAPVLSLAAYGDHVVAIDGNQSTDAFSLDGTSAHLSDFGMPFGAATNADYAIFPVAVDSLPGGVSEALGGRMPDTDLYLYSFKTNQIYNALEERGQQGFPSVSGNRLVWQDGVFGGDDIMSVNLPPGL